MLVCKILWGRFSSLLTWNKTVIAYNFLILYPHIPLCIQKVTEGYRRFRELRIMPEGIGICQHRPKAKIRQKALVSIVSVKNNEAGSILLNHGAKRKTRCIARLETRC